MTGQQAVELVVGRIGRAHGIRGDLFVDVRTDDPGLRFAPGTSVLTDPRDKGPLLVADARMHSGRLVVHFAGVDDRSTAESMAGTLLVVQISPDEVPDNPEDFYDHHLVGLEARTPEGKRLGEVTEVLHLPSQDVLVVRRDRDRPPPTDQADQPDGAPSEVLVPFVTAIVPVVDLAAGVVVVDAPPGLFDPQRAEVAFRHEPADS